MQNTFSQSGNDSKWFSKKSFFRIGMWNPRPPPLHGKIHLKFPFWLFAPLLNPHQRKGIQVHPLQKFIWWSWNPKKARTHPQWREEKTYTCWECQKSFGRRGTLRNHMVTHTGKKVQKCAECGDSFPRPFILKTHLLTHSGKKPHNCTQSDFASSRAGNLEDRNKTHS